MESIWHKQLSFLSPGLLGASRQPANEAPVGNKQNVEPFRLIQISKVFWGGILSGSVMTAASFKLIPGYKQ